jgi:hypothetical protein
MSSYRYSPPSMPSPEKVADMVMFYASPSVRDRLRMGWPEDAGLLEDLVEQAFDLAATWKPTTDWHVRPVVWTGRTVDWMVWQVATAADDEMGPMYREDPVMPFAIDLATLPRYPLLPTLLVHPDDLD